MTVNQMANLGMGSVYRSLYTNQAKAAKSLRNIATGYRINTAADDAAGLAVSEKMRGQIGGLSMAIQNAQNAVTLVQTADGYLDSTSQIITRMQELATQSANGTYSQAERDNLNLEFQSLKDELNRIADSANYNGKNLLDGTLGATKGAGALNEVGFNNITATGTTTGTAKFNVSHDGSNYNITMRLGDETVEGVFNGSSYDFTLANGDVINVDPGALQEGVLANVEINGSTVDFSNALGSNDPSITFQIGANNSASDRMDLHIGDMSSVGLGVWDLDISSVSGANAAISSLKDARNTVSSQRGELASAENRLGYTINNLTNTHENLVAAESRIRDADMAKEIMNYTQSRIRVMAAQAMMAQGMNLSRQYMLGILMR